MRTKDTVAIGWADPGHVDGEFAVALAQLSVARASWLGGMIRVEGSALISRIRNEIASAFLDRSEAAWLLMIDSDESLPVPAFDKLIGAAHDKSHPIVAGLYFGARPTGGLYATPEPLIFREQDGMYAALHDYPRDRVIPVDAAGTGCLLIHRSVLEAMRAVATPDEGDRWCFFQDGPSGGHWYGEDVNFCRRAKALGFPIHAHTGAVLPHRKRYWITEAHHDLFLSQQKG